MKKSDFDRRLLCFVERMDYDFKTRTRWLYMPPDNCTAMTRAIKLFRGSTRSAA